MKKVILSVFLLAIFCLSMGSCTIEKRLHTRGYHVTWNKKKVKSNTHSAEKESAITLNSDKVEQGISNEEVVPTVSNHGEDQPAPVFTVFPDQDEEREELLDTEYNENVEMTTSVSEEVIELPQSKAYQSTKNNDTEMSTDQTSQFNSENNASAGGSALSVIGWILIILGIIVLLLVSILIGILVMLAGLAFVLGGSGMRRKARA
ncbi:MAG: hypothetical protein AB8B56_03155 [Crocinitomicaceae bacterium]